MCQCEKISEMEKYAHDAEKEIGALKRRNKALQSALHDLESAVNQSISGIRKSDVKEWNALLSKAQSAMESNS